MYVNDYVSRERKNGGMSSNSNVINVQHGGSTSVSPPSIHMD